jgi:hypothetical protein
MRLIGLYAVLLAAQTFGLAQGPIDGYLKGKGKLDIAVSLSANSAKEFYGANGTSFQEPYKGNLIALFAEYGITKNLDIVATLPYVFTSTQTGLQDGSLHLKGRIFQVKTQKRGQIDLLAAAGISSPLSSYEPLAAGALGQRATVVQPRLLAQWNTKTGPFINGTIGYNIRLDDLNAEDIDRIRALRPDYQASAPRNYTTFLLKIGLPAKRYYLDAWVEHQSTRGGTDFVPMLPDLPQAYGVTYTQVGGTAYYSEGGKRGVYISSGYLLSGRNVSNVLRLTAGVVFKL